MYSGAGIQCAGRVHGSERHEVLRKADFRSIKGKSHRRAQNSSAAVNVNLQALQTVVLLVLCGGLFFLNKTNTLEWWHSTYTYVGTFTENYYYFFCKWISRAKLLGFKQKIVLQHFQEHVEYFPFSLNSLCLCWE